MKRPLMGVISDELWNQYCKINYVPMPEIKKPKKFYKISVCTTCMNRLEDLKQTYLKNIKDNIEYPNVEWVLLNYNSDPNICDIDTWSLGLPKDRFAKDMVKYYKTEEPTYYSMAHSRNVAFKLATGDIVTSVDADHFINKGFLSKLNDLFNALGPKTILVKSEQKNRGRIAMFKKDFIDLGGYDEDLKDYGHEDRDLLFRASAMGFKVCKYGGDYFTLADGHSRHPVSNYYDKDWRFTQERNGFLSFFNLMNKRYIANQNRPWGEADLV